MGESLIIFTTKSESFSKTLRVILKNLKDVVLGAEGFLRCRAEQSRCQCNISLYEKPKFDLNSERAKVLK